MSAHAVGRQARGVRPATFRRNPETGLTECREAIGQPYPFEHDRTSYERPCSVVNSKRDLRRKRLSRGIITPSGSRWKRKIARISVTIRRHGKRVRKAAGSPWFKLVILFFRLLSLIIRLTHWHW